MKREPFLLEKAINVILTSEDFNLLKNNSNYETNNFCSIIDRNV